MKTLLLVRHAKTEQLSFDSQKSDFERELKPRGFKDSELIAGELIKREAQPDVLISSKAMRAKQTAHHLSELLGINNKDIIFESFLYGSYTASQLINYLAQFKDKHQSIMIVGHNPEIAMTAMSLTDSDYLHFPTTGTIAISFDVDNWSAIKSQQGTVEWLITPKMLK